MQQATSSHYSATTLIQLREQGLKNILQGQQEFNQAKNAQARQQAMQLYVLGIENLTNYIKMESNQKTKEAVKAKLMDFFQTADQMKIQVNCDQAQNPVPKIQNLVVPNVNPPKKVGYIQRLDQGIKAKQTQQQQQQQQQQQIKPIQQQQQKFQPLPVQQKELQNIQNTMNKQLNLQDQQQQQQQKLTWDDVAGLKHAKDALQEAVIIPNKFPGLFTGIRQPWRGILLYGPPGTGKTFLAKVCAEECGCTFFSISSADLISKYVGDSEKALKSLFTDARSQKPSIIFIDEIDSMTSSREGGDNNESSNRLKTQFLVEMQGVNGNENDGILVLGATNLPWSLDPAIRRRFEKRIYIGLPDRETRKYLVDRTLKGIKHKLKPKDIDKIALKTEHYSAADISILVRDAAFQPIRLLQKAKRFEKKKVDGKIKFMPLELDSKKGVEKQLMELKDDDLILPDLSVKDFDIALAKVRPSVCKEDTVKHIQFTKQFGESD